MRRRTGVGAGSGAGERAGEALVEAFDRDVDGGFERFDEPIRLFGLRAVLAAEGQRKPDHDPVRFLLADDRGQPRQARLAGGPLDDFEWTGDRPGRVRDGDARARRAIVEREHLHFSAAAMLACRPRSAPEDPRDCGRRPPRAWAFLPAPTDVATEIADELRRVEPGPTSDSSRFTTR